MKKKELYVVLFLSMSIFFVVFISSCTIKVNNLIFKFTTTENTTFSTSTVLIEWSTVDGIKHHFSCMLDNSSPTNVNENFIKLSGISAGKHVIKIKPLDIEGDEKSLNFSVDLSGPSVTVKATDRTGIAHDSNDTQPFGRNTLIAWQYDTYEIGRNFISFAEVRDDGLHYIKTDGNGNHSFVSSRDESKIELDKYSRSFYVSNNKVEIEDKEYDIFDVGKDYYVEINGINTEGTVGKTGYITFRLNERYVDSDTPMIYISSVEQSAPTPSSSGTIRLTVKAQNVKEYCDINVHEYFSSDITYNDELMFIQLEVEVFSIDFYEDYIILKNINMPHFKTGYDDYNGHNISEYSPSDIYIYKTLVKNISDTLTGTDTLAILEFSTDKRLSGSEICTVINYGNCCIRDVNNRSIDGIQIDHYMYNYMIPEQLTSAEF